MGWFSLFHPSNSLLTAAKLTGIYSNFAAVMYQEPGSPQPRGVWSMEGLNVASGVAARAVSSFDALNIMSGLSLAGRPQQLLQQRVSAAKYAVQTVTSAGFSTYMVACVSPVYSDSTLLVRAELSGVANPQVTGISIAQYNLCRQPNSAAPIVLTNCSGTATTGDPIDALGMLLVASMTVHGGLSLSGMDSSQPAGVSVHYGIRALSHLGSNLTRTGRIVIEEWR
jgi:hypothetical protein